MANFGGAQSSSFQIGIAELRIGALSEAGNLTSKHSVGLVKNATINVAKTYAELRAGAHNTRIHQALTGYDLEMNAELYEFTTKNLIRVLGSKTAVANFTPVVTPYATADIAANPAWKKLSLGVSTDPKINKVIKAVGGTAESAAYLSSYFSVNKGATSVTTNSSYGVPMPYIGFVLPDSMNTSLVAFFKETPKADSVRVVLSQESSKVKQSAVLWKVYYTCAAGKAGVPTIGYMLSPTAPKDGGDFDFTKGSKLYTTDGVTTKVPASDKYIDISNLSAADTSTGYRAFTVSTAQLAEIGISYDATTDADNDYVFKIYSAADARAIKTCYGQTTASGIQIRDEGQFPAGALTDAFRIYLYSVVTLAPTEKTEFFTAQLATKNSLTGDISYFNLWKVAYQGNLDFSFTGTDYNTIPLKLVAFEPTDEDMTVEGGLNTVKKEYDAGSIFGNIATV